MLYYKFNEVKPCNHKFYLLNLQTRVMFIFEKKKFNQPHWAFNLWHFPWPNKMIGMGHVCPSIFYYWVSNGLHDFWDAFFNISKIG